MFADGNVVQGSTKYVDIFTWQNHCMIKVNGYQLSGYQHFSFFVFNRRMKLTLVWNNMMVSK